MRFRQAALALVLLSVLLLAPTSAQATRSDPDNNPFTGLSVAGSSPAGEEFVGTLDIRAFETRDGRLVAVGTLSGQVTRTVGAAAVPLATLDEAPVEVAVSTVTATCERLALAFGPVPLGLHGPTVTIDPIRIDESARPEGGDWPERQLCAIADRLRRAAPPRALAGLLDVVARSYQ